jgi:hypothetical protein
MPLKAFVDHDRDPHPEGEKWTFLRSAFVPYHFGTLAPVVAFLFYSTEGGV